MARRRARTALVALVALAGLGAACGSATADPAEQAEALIETELADQAGLGPLVAACADAEGVGAGDTFTCTGTTEDGRVVEFTAEVEEGGAGEVTSTNLATPDDIPRLTAEAARVLGEENGVQLPPEAMTCDDSRGLIIEAGATLDCTVVDPRSGDELDAVITITDPENLGFEVELVT